MHSRLVIIFQMLFMSIVLVGCGSPSEVKQSKSTSINNEINLVQTIISSSGSLFYTENNGSITLQDYGIGFKSNQEILPLSVTGIDVGSLPQSGSISSGIQIYSSQDKDIFQFMQVFRTKQKIDNPQKYIQGFASNDLCYVTKYDDSSEYSKGQSYNESYVLSLDIDYVPTTVERNNFIKAGNNPNEIFFDAKLLSYLSKEYCGIFANHIDFGTSKSFLPRFIFNSKNPYEFVFINTWFEPGFIEFGSLDLGISGKR